MNGLCTIVFVVLLVQLKIEYSGASIQVNVGDQYSFVCGITVTSVKAYQWQTMFSPASYLNLYDDSRLTGTNSNIMTITNITITDAGTYRCVVTYNSGAIQTANTVILQVVSPTVINGNWGSWTSWGVCSVTCEGGTQTRTRLCNDPSPANGGSDCSGSGTESRSCNTGGCPVNGNWGSWTSWSGCSVTCEEGSQTRTGLCNNPVPANGGSACSGSGTESQTCHTGVDCPINGNWGSWTSWSGCSVTCEEGSQTRTGLCNNPVPANGGSACSGSGTESQTCHTGVDCPINGNWGTWTSWSVCSGTQTRTGQCTNPEPANGGSDCVGSGTESQSCYTGLSCQASTSSLNEKSQSAIIGVLVAAVMILLISLVVLIIHHRRRMKESSSLQTVKKDNAQGSRHDYANDLVNEHVSYLKLDRRSGGGTSVTETNYDDLQISNDAIEKDDTVYYEINPETS